MFYLNGNRCCWLDCDDRCWILQLIKKKEKKKKWNFRNVNLEGGLSRNLPMRQLRNELLWLLMLGMKVTVPELLLLL